MVFEFNWAVESLYYISKLKVIEKVEGMSMTTRRLHCV